AGNYQVMIHQVAGGYPASRYRVNLSQIPVLYAAFPEAAIGYSSHVSSWHVDAAAIVLGASMVEKNLTLDRSGAGPEQSMAVEPGYAGDFVRAMHNVWEAIGYPERKRITSSERDARSQARRCAYATESLLPGALIRESDFEYRRPAESDG